MHWADWAFIVFAAFMLGFGIGMTTATKIWR